MKSITAILLFGAIILVFVFFGLPSRLRGGPQGYAARVGNKLISVADLRGEASRLEQMYAPMFGGQTPGDAQRQFLRRQAMENLIVQEMMDQSAQKAGIITTDKEVQSTIVNDIPVFQKDGHFQRDLYFQLLEANHLTPAGFEEKLRMEKRSNRLRGLLEIGAEPLQYEIDKLQMLHSKQISLSFVHFDRPFGIVAVPISDAEAKSHLADPQFKQRAENYYKDNKFQYRVEPQVHALHILIKSSGQPGDDELAMKKIHEVQEKLKHEDFQKVAKEYSEDEGTKAKGGDLGYFLSGQMVPEFDAAAFSQKIGEIGPPVKTQYGYHLIKVLDRKEAQDRPFDEVKEDVAKELLGSDRYQKDLKELEAAVAQGNQSAVDAMVKKMGFTWEETGFFDAAVDTVPKLNSQTASIAAFTLSKEHPLYTQLVKDGEGRFILKWKGEKTDVEPVKNLAQSLERERAYEMANSWIEYLRKNMVVERNPEALSAN
jgi:parvulin-like peptidyl-prolyl isomerase